MNVEGGIQADKELSRERRLDHGVRGSDIKVSEFKAGLTFFCNDNNVPVIELKTIETSGIHECSIRHSELECFTA